MTSIFNYFSIVFSGYQRKSKSINGVKVHFKYKYGTELFNPFKILQDQFFKLQQVKEEFVFDVPDSNYSADKILNRIEQKNPRVSCWSAWVEGYLEVNRYVVKEGDRVTSFYIFFFEGELLAFLHKKYDYGRERKTIIESEIMKGADKREVDFSNEDEPIVFKIHDKGIYVEKFVHTHLFFVADTHNFEKVCKQMNGFLEQKITWYINQKFKIYTPKSFADQIWKKNLKKMKYQKWFLSLE